MGRAADNEKVKLRAAFYNNLEQIPVEFTYNLRA